MAAAGPRTTGPRFPSGRPPSGQAEQGNRGEGAAGGALPGTPAAAAAGPPGTHLRPAAEAGPRGPGSLREEPGPSRSCSPRDPFAGPAPPSPEAKEPAAAGAAPRPRAPAGGGASRRVVTSPRPPPAALLRAYMRTRRPAARLPGGGWGAGMSAGGAGPTRMSHRLFYCRRGTGSCGSPEDGFVTWLKPRCARHLSVLPSLGGEVFVGVLWFGGGGGCAPVSVLSSSSACPLGGGGGG